MARPGVFMTDIDSGSFGLNEARSYDGNCGLLFDISGQGSDFWTTGAGQKAAAALKDNVVELNSINDALSIGIEAFDALTPATAKDYLLNGVVYYHIKKFFDRNKNGVLYLMLADCSQNWDAIIEMQNAARGYISQVGVWTEKRLWKQESSGAESYSLQLVNELDAVASSLANEYHSPLVILLSANTAKVSEEGTTVALSKIPSVNGGKNRYVSVLLGQDATEDVAAMQGAFDSCTPVGVLGIALACLAEASVKESIGWVQNYNLSAYINSIELGFGDVSKSVDGTFVSTTPYISLKRGQINALDDKGYIFLLYYAAQPGVYFSSDKTCSDGDFRTISRNRAINKSRRLVRAVLLPFVNSPIKVDAASGQLSAAQTTIFVNAVSDALSTMVSAEEISGVGTVLVPANQDVLKTDIVNIKYSIIPYGTAREIDVEEGFSITQ